MTICNNLVTEAEKLPIDINQETAMSRTIELGALALLFSVILGLHAHASAIPEKLDYELTWSGIKIGTSSIRTAPAGQELEIVSTVHSAAWSDPFYRVDDIETSKLKRDNKGFTLHQYKMKLHEGTSDWYRAVTIDRKDNRFRFYNLVTGEKTSQKLAKQAWDPISCLYHLRQQSLTVGKVVYVNVLDKHKLNRIKVNVVRRETVTTPAGTFRTIVISPEMNISSEGLFYARGPLTIWLTDDDRKLPVVIEKRIEELFREGVPEYLQRFTPASVRNNLPRMETIRAVLVGGSW